MALVVGVTAAARAGGRVAHAAPLGAALLVAAAGGARPPADPARLARGTDTLPGRRTATGATLCRRSCTHRTRTPDQRRKYRRRCRSSHRPTQTGRPEERRLSLRNTRPHRKRACRHRRLRSRRPRQRRTRRKRRRWARTGRPSAPHRAHRRPRCRNNRPDTRSRRKRTCRRSRHTAGRASRRYRQLRPIRRRPTSGAMHCPSLQQPSGQDVLLQTHCPAAQAWPDAQEAQTDPFRPQTPSVMEVTQWPFESQQPDAQAAALDFSADRSTEVFRALPSSSRLLSSRPVK